MSTRIDEREMTDSATRHRAVVVDGADQYDTGAWRVTWLPDVALDRNQAITAMTLVEYVASGITSADHPKWAFVKGWAAELGLDPAEAVRLILARTDDEVVTEIRKAVVRWRFVQAEHDRIMPLAAVLADEKIQALGMTRTQWERVIGRLALTDGVHVDGEADQKRLTDEDRAAAVTLGGTARHTIRYTAEYTLASEGDHLYTAEEKARAAAPADEQVSVEEPTGVFLVRDYVLAVERAVVGGQWDMVGLVRGVPADVLSRIDAREPEILRMIVHVVDDYFEPTEVLLCSLYDQAGDRIDTREINYGWTATALGWV